VRYVDSETSRGSSRTIIVDEVQEIDDWERGLASLLGSGNTRILISGSNASLLSGELETRITGRYLTFRVFPLSLPEFRDLHQKAGNEKVEDPELFRIYLRLGGLPGILHTDLSSYAQEAFLCEIVNRFDIKGRRRMEVNNKLYLGDIGLRNGLLGFHERDIGGILENLVYLELRRRGFTVSVGLLREREIDFVAEAETGRYYIQVAYQLGTRSTLEREIKPFSALDDAYPRILLSMDPLQPRDLNGIRHQSILDFLLGADLLN
jgi:predicted AAA+ superfamily ATPase